MDPGDLLDQSRVVDRSPDEGGLDCVVRRRSELHAGQDRDSGDRLDPVIGPVGVDVGDDHLSLRSSSVAAKTPTPVSGSVGKPQFSDFVLRSAIHFNSSVVVQDQTPPSISV